MNPWEEEYATPDGGPAPWEVDYEAPAVAPKPVPKKKINAAPATVSSKIARGAIDPIEGSAQLLYNAIPQSVRQAGDRFNNWLADQGLPIARIPQGGMNELAQQNEQKYQASREAAGESGFDGWRMTGNVISPANFAVASRIPAATTLGGRVATGAATGAGFGAVQPVTQGEYWDEKGKQAAIGAVAGAALPAVTSGVARVVSPRASNNPQLQMLKKEGVQPTIGQTLGGRWNAAEEKLQSLPIAGDAIANARGRALEQFNRAAINRATAPVGAKIDDIGQDGVRAAGNMVGQAYDDAQRLVSGVRFDKQFSDDFSQLRSMSTNLLPGMKRKFDKLVAENIGKRVSPNGSMLPDTYKKVVSELDEVARDYAGSSTASEREFGKAVLQLKSLIEQQATRNSPEFAAAQARANAGWANLVRVEDAAKRAANSGGVFTPGQLNQAIRATDGSVRKRAVSRGTALMQDLANAGQSVVGNKVPNSFTTDRLLIGLGSLGAGALHPAIPASLVAGAGMYTPQAQRALSFLTSARPQAAIPAAQAVRNSAPFLTPGVVPAAYGLLGAPQ